ncbi:uncharacterized protein LOC110720380 isoform X2 [Chenopodium quinoa]|uniref:uncharacterized protein LOC110720380 isoform X2 n=1 Tax=Chenopodium quinoa TaxID=63459 RepID=UPI000B778557|nr:uncharacterized protein LOC110720380 isoform X2 [Chenopodium quinoa]
MEEAKHQLRQIPVSNHLQFPKIVSPNFENYKEDACKFKQSLRTKESVKIADKKDKFVSEDFDTQGSVDDHVDEYEGLKDSGVKCSPKGEDDNKVLSSTSRGDVHPALKKKKLHWGLDAKERWERKANM